jgi:hypothetical protein
VTGADAHALSTTTGLGWSSWGEHVEVLVRPIDSHAPSWSCPADRCCSPTSSILAKNLENVGQVVSRVEQAIAAPRA